MTGARQRHLSACGTLRPGTIARFPRSPTPTMEFTTLGHSDLRVSKVCLGTMTFGEQNSEAEARAQLDLAVAHGVNFIDAAEMYPVAPRAATAGRTESDIGTWLKHQPRDQLIVATKITAPTNGLSSAAYCRGVMPMN